MTGAAADRNDSPDPLETLMNNLKLEILSQQAQEAVACSYCFMPERTLDWKRVPPTRPPDRPDDVAMAPSVGSRYSMTSPRVTVVMMNPGHAPAQHKVVRQKLGRRLKDGEISYEEYNRKLALLVPEWGFGGVVRWLRALKLEPESIAFLNLALCAVAGDRYFPELFGTCFIRHTRNMMATLEPDAVVLCGKKWLEPYEESIKSLGTNVILTWHYRPMNTGKGKTELQRVRAELDKLTIGARSL